FFQAEDGIRDLIVTGVQTCALPIYRVAGRPHQEEDDGDQDEDGGDDEKGADDQVAAETASRSSLRLRPFGPGGGPRARGADSRRSEERRVGKGWQVGCGASRVQWLA